jgi:4-carboxymuconolactone decarboxylase
MRQPAHDHASSGALRHARYSSLVTVAVLVALNRAEQLRFHLPNAVKNGVKEEELIEAITHLAFYSGWPNAMSAMAVAKELFEKPGASEDRAK